MGGRSISATPQVPDLYPARADSEPPLAGGGGDAPDAGDRVERAGDLPDVDKVRSSHVADIPRVLDPALRRRRGVGGGVVLVVGRRSHHVVVVAVVDGADPLRA